MALKISSKQGLGFDQARSTGLLQCGLGLSDPFYVECIIVGQHYSVYILELVPGQRRLSGK